MENGGYIKLYRKTLDNPIICKDSDYFSVWIYLLLNATHDEFDVIFKENRITLKAGQLITGRKIIAKKFNIDENKVQRILKNLEKQHQIEQETSTKNRLISIVKWNEYQLKQLQNEQQVNNKRTTSEQQVNTNKNVKNDKNVKNERNNISAKANKRKYGEYENVLLKDEELQKLKEKYSNWEELIKYLDEYIEMKGYKAKSHYLCIIKWVVDAVSKQNKIGKLKGSGLQEWLKEKEEQERNAV